MHVVYRRKDAPDVWEVAWTWFPWFLANDSELHQRVGEHLNKRFLGRVIPHTEHEHERLLEEMHQAVIGVCLSQYPGVSGLDKYLNALDQIQGAPDEGGRHASVAGY